MKNPLRRLFHLTLITAGLFAPAGHLAAATWSGEAGTSNWQDAGNWSTGAVPVGSENAFVNDSVTVAYDSATNYLTSGLLQIGAASGNTTVVDISGPGTLRFGGNGYSTAAQIGANGGNATVNISDGKLQIGTGLAGDDASINLGRIGPSPTGTLNISGGEVQVGRRILMADYEGNTGNATLTLSGTGLINMVCTGLSNEFDLGMLRVGSGTNTLNFDGGTFQGRGIRQDRALSTSNIHYNSTRFVLNGNSAAGVSALIGSGGSAANRIKDGGLEIDTNGFNGVIARALADYPDEIGVLTKNGAGRLTLAAANNTYSETVVNEGSVDFSVSDVFRTVTAATHTLTINEGALVTNSTGDAGYVTLQNLNLNGGELRATNTLSATSARYQAYGIKDTAMVGGTVPSLISDIGQANGFINIGGTTDLGDGVGSNLLFEVEDVTGDSAPDLTVSAKLQSSALSTGLDKSGAGTLLLTRANTYSGPTHVIEGTLALAEPFLHQSSTVTVDAGAFLHLTHSQTDVIAELILEGTAQPEGIYHAGNSGGRITGTGSIQVIGVVLPITEAIGKLRSHLSANPSLTAAQINQQSTIIRQGAALLGTDAAIIADAFNLVNTYETTRGHVFTRYGNPLKHGWDRGQAGFELQQAILTLQQAIIDRTYTSASLAQHEALLGGWKFLSSAYFPGSVAPPANPAASRTVLINASQPKAFGAPVMYENWDARRPTGSYLAPGSIGVVTVPAALVNKGFKIRVGAHSWDLSAKSTIKRHDRSTIVYNITSTTMKIASPLGGGIYIEVPYLASQGVVPVQIANAVRSPFYSSVSHRPATTLAEWTTERSHPGPWADFESDKFMMQVPRSWVYAFANPVTLMQDWDKAMDSVSDLFGYPRVRSKTVMYAHTDVIFRVGVNAPGYPMSNDNYNPYASTNGTRDHYLLNGPKFSPWVILHELGHAQQFTKFLGEIESAVNLLYVPVHHQHFGVPLEQAFGRSIGDEPNSGVNLSRAALLWILKAKFRTGNKTMLVGEMNYQHRGHAKYVEIARLFGWKALGDFWRSVHLGYENGVYPSNVNSDPADSRILRMSQAAGADLRPLFHMWGVPPINASSLAGSINAAGLQPSGAIYRRLKDYQAAVPTSLQAFKNYYWTIAQTGPDAEIKGLFDTYTPAIGTSAVNAIQGLINLYFPNGDPDVQPDTWTWDISPGTAGAGNGAINTGAGTWSTTASNWTKDGGANNAPWVNGANAVFGSGIYTVDLGSGLSARNLTVLAGSGNVTLQAAADNGALALVNNPVWNIHGNELHIAADSVRDTRLTMTSGQKLTVTGTGVFNTGEKPAGADWGVAGAHLDVTGTVTLRGNALGVGKFSSVKLAAGTRFFHERDAAETYANNWILDGEGQVVFDNRYDRTFTLNGVASGSGGISVQDLGSSQALIMAKANTYTGPTTVSAAILRAGVASTAVGNGAFGRDSAVTLAPVAGTVMDINGFNTRIGSLTGGGEVLLGSATLTTGGDGTSPPAFSGVISGTGSFSKTGGGIQRLSGANTFTGLTQISGGILNVASFSDYGVGSAIGARTLAQESPTANTVGLCFGPGNATGVLQYTGSTPQSTNRHLRMGIGGATIDASGTVPSATLSFTRAGTNVNLFDTAGLRTLSLTGTNTGANTFAITLTDQAANATSLVKSGPGTWVVTGENTYTGSTTVEGGILAITRPYLANAADVILVNNGVIHLDFNGITGVNRLFIGGIRQQNGTWGSLQSTATHRSARITGTGILNVGNGDVIAPVPPFATWAGLSGLDGSPGKESGFLDDPDQDGLVNGLEWILGGDPLGASGQLTLLGSTDTHLTFSFTREDASEASTTLRLQWSTALGAWNEAVIGPASSGPDANGVSVAVTENGSAPDSIIVTIPRNLEIDGKLFLRLSAAF